MKKLTIEQELELKGIASKKAVEAFRESKHDIVTLSMGVNAWGSGFYAGVRYWKTYAARDVRTWWQKFFHPAFTIDDIANSMAKEYVQQFPSLSRESLALTLSSAATGFTRGYEYALNPRRCRDGEPVGSPEA